LIALNNPRVSIIIFFDPEKRTEARDLFKAIVAETRIQPKFYRRAQKKWVEMAKKEI
jgi:quinol monooxygenase YgiN